MSVLTPSGPTRRASRHTLAAAVALLAAPAAAGAATFYDPFTNGIDPAHWTTAMTTPGLYTVDATHGDVRFAKVPTVASPGGFQNVRLALNLAAVAGGPVAGDFSTQVVFRDAQVTGPVFNQVQFEAYFADGSAFLDVFDNYGSPSIGLNVHVWDGYNIRGPVALAAGTTAGTLRIDRVGGVATAYFDGAPVFSLAEPSALTTLRFSLQNNHDNDVISVTYDDFSLTSATAIPEPAAPAALLSLLPATLLARRRPR